MKQSAKLLFVFILLFALSALSNAQDGSVVKTKSFNVDKGGVLNVAVSSGDIFISTWNKNEVGIKIKADDNDILNNISTTLAGNTVKIKSDRSNHWNWSGNVSIFINIPTDFNTEINTMGGDVRQTGDLKGTATIFTAGGDVTIGNVTGRTTLKSNGGDITTGNIGNDLNLSTNGGDVRTGIINGKANINTMGGDITIKSAGSSTNVSTMGGDINIGNIGGKAQIKTMGGSIEVGKVSGNASINTYGGDISLSGAKGSIDATTYGGGIRMTNLIGSVNADTKSGDVYIELNPSENGASKIKSMNGNVTLYLPANAKVYVSATVLARHYNKYEDEKDLSDLIRSDFGTQSQLLTQDRKGDKIITKYSINGGGNSNIEIYTVNGTIEIKKK
ncbi:MAG: hypothetical protein WB996_00090 [Ignavibacteriaceae bacterium]